MHKLLFFLNKMLKLAGIDLSKLIKENFEMSGLCVMARKIYSQNKAKNLCESSWRSFLVTSHDECLT